MPRDFRLLLADILHSIGRIAQEAAESTAEDLANRIRLQESVLWNLHVIGEAAKQLPEDFRRLHPEVNWKQLAALRDKVIHAYFGIKWEIIEDTIRNKLPEAGQAIALIIELMPSEDSSD